ncbi:DUF1848 domain-containing protein [Desulforegula conservatrix]|uniref:DUF1848 domain-containing protein n=1 Tax=Desulforegula conservatrix TaxID=153026 RepID=UPI000416DAC1|nr:DUF1848 domain-containing protein [Desulforegula conservatrix]
MASKTVISASRRTDIPAFYMPWLMRRLELGFVETENPFNARKTTLDLRPESVHSIVLWSKNYSPFIDGCYAEKITGMGYRLFFQFTLNARSIILEPGVPCLRARLEQAGNLSKIHGPEAIEWRFDPVCFFMEKGRGLVSNNLAGFEEIASSMSRIGISRCVTSFLDIYRKLKKREENAGIRFIEPDSETKLRTIEYMHGVLKKFGMKLRLCCESGLLGDSPEIKEFITPGGCIDSRLLMDIHGGSISTRPDKGQRKTKGCTCTESRDIGSYRTQPCFHNCLYCYAA